MRITKQREQGVSVSYHHNFADSSGHLCAGFECSKEGVIKTPEHEAGRRNLADCIAGADGIQSMGVQEYRHRWTEDAEGECVQCKGIVRLSGFTNTCMHCGADYNMSGQLLAPRSQWGEETGETASDILMGASWDIR